VLLLAAFRCAGGKHILSLVRLHLQTAVSLFPFLQHRKNSVELHHEPYLANSLPCASISTRQDFAVEVRPMR
jgi:hypothetical protein